MDQRYRGRYNTSLQVHPLMKSKSNNAYFQKLLAFDVSRKFYVLAFDTILFCIQLCLEPWLGCLVLMECMVHVTVMKFYYSQYVLLENCFYWIKKESLKCEEKKICPALVRLRIHINTVPSSFFFLRLHSTTKTLTTHMHSPLWTHVCKSNVH